MNEELKTQLKELGLNEDQIAKLEAEGATTAADIAGLSAAEIKNCTDCGLVTAKKVAEAFAPKPSAPTSDPQAAMDILPSVPEDASFLDMLKVGGVLKVEKVDVISAMRAAIASQVGLYNLPDRIMGKMEQFADEQDEPVGENFYRLQKLVASHAYAEVLTAIGVPGNFVSDRRKNAMLTRLNEILWPSLQGFNQQLNAWSDSWAKGMANPAMALTFLALTQTGTRGIMPPGMLQPPETTGLRDEAEAVINKINKVFSGTGIPVARALAYDATRIKTVLEEPTLPSAVGATTKDQMLKMLGVDVGADYVRLERNVTRFALAVMELPKLNAGNEEYAYLGALLTLGLSIPWDKLGSMANVSTVKNQIRIRGDQPRDL